MGIAGDKRKEKCNNEADPCHAFGDGAAARLTRRLRREEGQQHRYSAARASGRSRYFNSAKSDLRYRQMLSNGRVHDADGFLFDGENTHYNTLR